LSEGFSVVSGAVGELFYNVNDAVIIARPGRVLAWNPAAERVLGMTAEAATAPGADLQPAFGDGLVVFWHMVEEGGQTMIECRRGSERIVEATAWRLGDDGGPTVVVLHDVTDARRHAEGLKTLNVLARDLLAQSSLDVLLTRIVDAAKELTRADFSALITIRDGTSTEVDHFVYNAPRELFPPRLPRLVGLLAVPVETRSVARLTDIRGHPAGAGIPVEHPPIAALLAAPIIVNDDVIGELAVANRPDRPVFDDVDEAMLVELAAHGAMAVSLVRAREAQHQVAATRRALMDTALHNIRTPLTVAKGFVSTLRAHFDSLTPAEREDAFDAIERAHERMQALAEGSLLDHPLTESNRESEGIVVADLARLVAEDMTDVRRDVELRWEFEPDAPTTFRSDGQLVRELMGNLVSNAMKHAPTGTPVTITARREGDSIRFDVSDKGPGIPPEEQARVFEQFYRTRQSAEAGVAGTGLGLWIVRRLGELLGGTVGLSSRKGQGTTFWATFPLLPRA
jgi:signal transduction histidine kinase